MSVLDIRIAPCAEEIFSEVVYHLNAMQLDNRDLNRHDFCVAVLPTGELAGFGRLRKYNHCGEICSVGVLEEYRGKGIGKKIIRYLIDIFYHENDFNRKSLYVVTVIPKYFEKLNFEICTNVECSEVQEKLKYCIEHLSVPEKYEVMKLITNYPINQ